jgi:signal transduction histidine kinase
MQSLKKLITTIALLLFFINGNAEIASKGFIDFRQNKDFFSTPIDLNGEWDFYWQKSLIDINPKVASEKVYVPASWDHNKYNRYGFATYHIKVLIDSKKCKSTVGLYVPKICNNYNLYINQKKTASVGNFSINEISAEPDYKPQVVYFIPTSDTLDIYFEVSNYFYREGGINYPIKIGDGNIMNAFFNEGIIFSAFSAGVFFIMFIYFLSFFFVSKRDMIAIYFSLLCLTSCLRIISTDMAILRNYDISIPWEILVKIEFISIYSMITFGGLFLTSFFPKQTNKIILHTICVINLLIILFTVFATVNISSYVMPIFKLFSIIQLMFLANVVFRALFYKERLSFMVCIGFLIVFLCGINDAIYSAEVIKSVYLLPIGLISFVFIMAFVVTRKFSLAFVDVKDLSEELAIVNKNQEDMLERRTLELNNKANELEKNNAVKDKILNIIAHDLRAPIKTLNQVLNWVEEDEELTIKETKKYLNSINRNVENLNLTIENLLTWSKKELNGINSDLHSFDIRSTINQVIELCRLQTDTKEIKLINQVVDRHIVLADSNHIHLILRNLISNAIKFSNPKGTIIISAFQINSQLQVCIADNGIGISPDAQSKLFKLNEHFTTYGTSNEKGTGLGLLLCKDYVEQNGGKLWLESEQGKGTKVIFRINMAN